MMSVDQIIRTAYPIFKGEIDTPYGKIIFGRMWHSWEVDFFTSECESQKIDVIWNLLEAPHGDIGTSKEVHSPIDDFDKPTDPISFCRDADLILNALKSGQKVFVHCHSGTGRTALALAIVLTKCGMSGYNALSVVKETTMGPETDIQCQFVLDQEKTYEFL
jgi:protein-tyrosine phosphatase